MASQTTWLTLVSMGLLGLAGCGANGPRTHPVEGSIRLAGGNVADLGGSYLEAALEGDDTVRASGQIQEDGRFILETLHGGKVRKGTQEGTYKVRIVLNDDDPKARRRAAQAIAPRYLKFDTSGLTIQVPSEEVNLEVRKKN